MRALSSRSQAAAIAPLPLPRSCLHHSHSLSLHPVPPALILPPRPSLSAATCRESNILRLSLFQLFCFSLLLHKLPKQKSVAGIAWRSTSLLAQLVGPAVANAQLARRSAPSRCHACPPSSPPSPSSRCALSTSSEAIGKQRPKMRFPVSSPSLTNK